MFKSLGFFAALLVMSGGALAHDPTEGPVSLEPDSVATSAGRSTYRFQLVDTKTELLITEKDLALSHEKKLHLVVYDPALKEFQHVHPAFHGDRWSVTLDFTVNGQYWVWAQGTLAKDNTEFNASNRLAVTGGKPEWQTPPTLGDVRSGVEGTSKATISASPISPARWRC